MTSILSLVGLYYKHSQKSEAKSQSQCNFFDLAQLQFPNLRNGQEKNGQIGGNSRRGIGNPSPDLADTVAWQLRIPELLHRHADEDEQEGDCDHPDYHKASNDIGPPLKEREVKDSIVHQQKGQLGPDQVVDVKNLGHQEIFGDQDSTINANFCDMTAHASMDHETNKCDNHKIPSLESSAHALVAATVKPAFCRKP